MTAPADRPNRTRSAVIALGLVVLVVGGAAIAFAILRDDDDAGAQAQSPRETTTSGATSGSTSSAAPAPATTDPRFAAFAETAIELRAADGAVKEHCVLVAETAEQRERGLMEQTDLGDYTGMLFRFDDETVRSFWMRNTPMPLSIAFFDGDREFVKALDMEPCLATTDCELYSSGSPAQFALEVPQGGLDRLGIGPGARFTIEDECGA